MKIPGYVFGIIGIVIAAIIYFFVVQVPFSQEQPELEKQHQADASQLQVYEDAEADKENLKARVSSMKEKYEKDSEELFINATQSPDDIMDMLRHSKTRPTTYRISEQTKDEKNRQSSSGDSLYSTDISITFNALDDAQIKSVLNYFESASKGAYYVDKLDIKAIEKTAQELNAAESSDKDGDSKKESSKNESSAAKSDLSSLFYTGKYQVTITLKLYYFLPADQTPEALKEEQNQATQSADNTASAVASSATESSGGESSAA